MRKRTAAMLAATILAGSSTIALAQDTDRGAQLDAAQQNAAQGQTASSQDRFERRSALRQQLRREGFRNIEIVDAAFAVQAQTPDGRRVLMIVNPAEEAAQAAERAAPQQEQSASLGQPREGAGSGREVQAVPVRLPNGQTIFVFVASDASRAGDQASRQEQQAGEPLTANPQLSERNPSAVEEEIRQEFTGAVTSELMSPTRAQEQLASRGFGNIGNWRREGETYTGTADWFGEEVDVQVDARSGDIIQPQNLHESQVETILTAEGYQNIGSVERVGSTFRAIAERDGTTYRLRLDAHTGEIVGRRERQAG